jgi:hypothetical protein
MIGLKLIVKKNDGTDFPPLHDECKEVKNKFVFEIILFI